MLDDFSALEAPSPWPNVNARLLGVGAGLPIQPLDRLRLFSADDFERFILEWADGYLARKVPGVDQVQRRGGANDRGRDVVVWFGAPGAPGRHCHYYQCKHLNGALGTGPGLLEVGKILFHAWTGSIPLPTKYEFVTVHGVVGPLQDLLDEPEKLRAALTEGWDNHCRKRIAERQEIPLEGTLAEYVHAAPFKIFRAKQPHEVLKEHAETRYHALVFGAPLIERPPAPMPPSDVAATESRYVMRLFEVITEVTGLTVKCEADFAGHAGMAQLFTRARLMFYAAEGLKELSRDQMADERYFEDLLNEFRDGLYHHYTAVAEKGHARLVNTIKASQHQAIPHGHPLAGFVVASAVVVEFRAASAV